MAEQIDPAGDIAQLRALKGDQDPRTIEEMIAADTTAETVTVDEVRATDDQEQHEVHVKDSFAIVLKGPQPKVGDEVTLYGGFGHPIYGWALNGQIVKYETPWERFAERMAMLAGFDRQRREDFARNKAQLDEKYEALPAPLKARIDRFRNESADFRVQSEGYEMAAVGDAPKIARALAEQHGWTLDDDLRVTDDGVTRATIKDAVQAFYDLGYEAQKALVPDLEPGHSGNTFGGAVSLAAGLLTGEVAEYEETARV